MTNSFRAHDGTSAHMPNEVENAINLQAASSRSRALERLSGGIGTHRNTARVPCQPTGQARSSHGRITQAEP